jgi:hypothetical protein
MLSINSDAYDTKVYLTLDDTGQSEYEIIYLMAQIKTFCASIFLIDLLKFSLLM